jgi:hypothetical protein
MNEKVCVTVNGKQATYFLGLAVRHAIGQRAARDVQAGRRIVCDADGHLVGLEGALYDGQVLVVRDAGAGSSDGARSSGRNASRQ